MTCTKGVELNNYQTITQIGVYPFTCTAMWYLLILKLLIALKWQKINFPCIKNNLLVLINFKGKMIKNGKKVK